MPQPPLRVGLWAVAGVQLATGLWMAVSPATFFSAVAGFGARNTHDLRDMATSYLASAAVLALSTARPSWRAPALALVGLQWALHALNHLADVGAASPGWVGPFDLVAITAGALLIGLLYREAVR